jgi:hypothetical protein
MKIKISSSLNHLLALVKLRAYMSIYRVPALEKLDLHLDILNDDDIIFDLSNLRNGPISFSIFIGPSSLQLPMEAIKLTYEAEGYSVGIATDSALIPIPEGYEDHFITLTPERGIFLNQQIAEDQAMINYHKALTQSDGMILNPQLNI